ncbi:Soluble epoxide hydrolase [Fusarium oxysporum f. sp. cubense race 1]|uniref:Soluble epoxide hydrolase n=1 Tax=Fusarium oxysporum f. sp. cubense (strain race 1) TaxID=1229664 RepID=N4TIC6_FUSC1|nr:Soluble epoxide hydrolase [Fusarium oxysporum f. sp. cubense race 1]
MSLKTIKTRTLEVGYYDHGPSSGWPVLLYHGFPYDIHAYDEVVPKLISSGARVVVPYVRGYGPTRFLSDSTMRSGQQAALGSDVIELMDALNIDKAVLGGFDWGGITAKAFDNPDFVNVVIHAYRFCFGNAKGDPALQKLEDALVAQPKISVPTITLDGRQDPLKPGGTAAHVEHFSGRYERREADVGHAFPMEAPDEFADAILTIHRWGSG